MKSMFLLFCLLGVLSCIHVVSSGGRRLGCRGRYCGRGSGAFEELRVPCGGQKPLTDLNGRDYFCGLGPAGVNCPPGSYCDIHPADAWAKCCPSSRSLRPCGGNRPLTYPNGRDYFCGRGPGRVDCPSGSYCDIHPADRWAKCCPSSQSSLRFCGGNRPLTYPNGRDYFCGRGPSRVNCPSGSYCDIHPADRWAKCCPSSQSSLRPCGGNRPLTYPNGRDYFCGRGPSRVDCPSGSYCDIHPADRWAKCCPGSHP